MFTLASLRSDWWSTWPESVDGMHRNTQLAGQVHTVASICTGRFWRGIAFEQKLLGEGRQACTGKEVNEYVVMGGGSQSDLWCQILADITGIPIVRSTTTEATCLGAGIVAATAVQWYTDERAAAAGMTNTADRFLPAPDRFQLYDHLYRDVYAPLFPALQPLIHRLSSLTHELD